MTKQELISALQEKFSSLTSKEVHQGVQHILEAMISRLEDGERIEMRGFGSFSLRVWGPRFARHPVSGTTWRTHPINMVHFRPGKLLREQVNPKKSKNPEPLEED